MYIHTTIQKGLEARLSRVCRRILRDLVKWNLNPKKYLVFTNYFNASTTFEKALKEITKYREDCIRDADQKIVIKWQFEEKQICNVTK